MQIQAPKGTKDVLPGESYKWQYIEKEMRDLCRLYGINELRTPIIEHTELFMRGVGDTTDIVQKEMYTFKDKGDRSITACYSLPNSPSTMQHITRHCPLLWNCATRATRISTKSRHASMPSMAS